MKIGDVVVLKEDPTGNIAQWIIVGDYNGAPDSWKVLPKSSLNQSIIRYGSIFKNNDSVIVMDQLSVGDTIKLRLNGKITAEDYNNIMKEIG